MTQSHQLSSVATIFSCANKCNLSVLELFIPISANTVIQAELDSSQMKADRVQEGSRSGRPDALSLPGGLRGNPGQGAESAFSNVLTVKAHLV